MPVPTSITDLSTTAASNSPAGSDSIGNPGKIDDYFRGYGAVQRAESLNKSWERWNDTPTYINATQFSVAGNLTARYVVGRRVKCTVTAGTVYGRISVSAFGTATTVTVVLDSGNLDSGLSEVQLGPETFAFPTNSAGLAALLSDETGSGAAVFGTSPTIATPTIAAPTFTGLVARAGVAATGSQWLEVNGTTTGYCYGRVANTTGYLIHGVESSAGGAVVAGSSAYASFIGSFSNTDFYLLRNQTIVVTLGSAATTVNGVLGFSDGGAKARNNGIVTEVGGSLIEFGINEDSSNRFGGSYTSADQGGMARFDTRAGQTLWTLHGRAAGSTGAAAVLMSVTSAGDTFIAGTLTSGAINQRGTAALSAQAANVAKTNLFTTTATGWYRVTVQIVVTQSATVSGTPGQCGIHWTDPDSNVEDRMGGLGASDAPTNTVGYRFNADYLIYAKTGTNISYSTSNYSSSGATPLQFALRATVHRMA